MAEREVGALAKGEKRATSERNLKRVIIAQELLLRSHYRLFHDGM